MIENRQLTENFWLYEFLKSSVAEREGGDVLHYQMNPTEFVIENLSHIAYSLLQPSREFMDCSITLNSGFRGKTLNKRVGGSETSQHCKGEAADVELSTSFLSGDSRTSKQIKAKRMIDALVLTVTGKRIRPDVNASFYLFAYFVLFLDMLDIDQVIHEYGSDGAPGWCHVSSSERQNKREILIKRTGEGYIALSAKDALLLGC